jgi:4-hydroxybenzoate polyprenyltransferase
MRVKVDTSALKSTKWHQVVLRFLFGGLITAAAGVIAKVYGPEIGGLFLAFPAIFPASATLIEKHERERKQKAGLRGTVRARKAVAVDAAGASIGSLGLLVFALVVQNLIVTRRPSLVVVSATLLWMLVSYLFWMIRKRL